ncbi:MAG: hypothetical protein K0A98_12960 [Trueperaceae bacterium]|nr:hypothetical protein [Trueperaceae bacterium]
MRKLILSLLAVAVLGTGSAFAQSWAGISTGWPGFAVHFGVENVIGDLDVRANVTSTYGFAFGIGADVLYDLAVDTGTLPLETYVGGGLNLIFVPGAVGVGLGAFGGVEYRLGELGLPEGGVFLEIGPDLLVVPAFGFGINARLGFNYHF